MKSSKASAIAAHYWTSVTGYRGHQHDLQVCSSMSSDDCNILLESTRGYYTNDVWDCIHAYAPRYFLQHTKCNTYRSEAEFLKDNEGKFCILGSTSFELCRQCSQKSHFFQQHSRRNKGREKPSNKKEHNPWDRSFVCCRRCAQLPSAIGDRWRTEVERDILVTNSSNPSSVSNTIAAANPASWTFLTLTSKLQLPRATKAKVAEGSPFSVWLVRGEHELSGLAAYSTPCTPPAGMCGAENQTHPRSGMTTSLRVEVAQPQIWVLQSGNTFCSHKTYLVLLAWIWWLLQNLPSDKDKRRITSKTCNSQVCTWGTQL